MDKSLIETFQGVLFVSARVTAGRKCPERGTVAVGQSRGGLGRGRGVKRCGGGCARAGGQVGDAVRAACGVRVGVCGAVSLGLFGTSVLGWSQRSLRGRRSGLGLRARRPAAP